MTTPSKEQKKLMDEFYDHTCFEFMGIHRVSGTRPKEFIKMWDRNIKWLRDQIDDADRIIDEYRKEHMENEEK